MTGQVVSGVICGVIAFVVLMGGSALVTAMAMAGTGVFGTGGLVAEHVR